MNARKAYVNAVSYLRSFNANVKIEQMFDYGHQLYLFVYSENGIISPDAFLISNGEDPPINYDNLNDFNRFTEALNHEIDISKFAYNR